MTAIIDLLSSILNADDAQPLPDDIDDDIDQLIMTTLNATVADVGQSAATSQGIVVIIIIK